MNGVYQMQNRPSVRIRELGDSWVIEQDGASIIAPFPLTNAFYGTDEYEEAAEDQFARFMAVYVEERATMPPALKETALFLCRICNRMDTPPFNQK